MLAEPACRSLASTSPDRHHTSPLWPVLRGDAAASSAFVGQRFNSAPKRALADFSDNGDLDSFAPSGLSIDISLPLAGRAQRMHAQQSAPKRQARIPLSVELGLSTSSANAHFLEDSWRGEILDGFLFLGDRVTASDSGRLRALGITHILNATEDVANFFCDSPHLHYHRCPIKDRSESAPDMEAHFPDCVRFIDSCAAESGRILVHCRAGVSRSATIVIGFLMQSKRWDLRTALHFVDGRRFVQPNLGFINFLTDLEAQIFGGTLLSSTAKDSSPLLSSSIPVGGLAKLAPSLPSSTHLQPLAAV